MPPTGSGTCGYQHTRMYYHFTVWHLNKPREMFNFVIAFSLLHKHDYYTMINYKQNCEQIKNVFNKLEKLHVLYYTYL